MISCYNVGIRAAEIRVFYYLHKLHNTNNNYAAFLALDLSNRDINFGRLTIIAVIAEV